MIWLGGEFVMEDSQKRGVGSGEIVHSSLSCYILLGHVLSSRGEVWIALGYQGPHSSLRYLAFMT